MRTGAGHVTNVVKLTLTSRKDTDGALLVLCFSNQVYPPHSLLLQIGVSGQLLPGETLRKRERVPGIV